MTAGCLPSFADIRVHAGGSDLRQVPPGADLARACDIWAGLPLLFQPGTEWNYSVATELTQLLPSSAYPIRPQLRQLVYQALTS